MIAPWIESLARGGAAASVAFAALVTASSLYIDAATPAERRVTLPPVDAAARSRVFVLAWGYHSSIFVEQPAGWRLGPEGDETAPFIEYGWGDRSYFMESNYAPHSVFGAAVLPTTSVVSVRGHDRPPSEVVVGGDIWVRDCSAGEVTTLVGALERQMVRGPGGERPAAFAQTPDFQGRFYPGRELYVVWTNCNEWTVRRLAESGLADSSSHVWLRHQVGGRLRGFRPAERTALG